MSDRRQLAAAVVLLITAAFVASRWVKPPYGVWWRRGVVGAYVLAVAIAVLWIAWWLLRS
jgi:hypothetical protein